MRAEDKDLFSSWRNCSALTRCGFRKYHLKQITPSKRCDQKQVIIRQ